MNPQLLYAVATTKKKKGDSALLTGGAGDGEGVKVDVEHACRSSRNAARGRNFHVASGNIHGGTIDLKPTVRVNRNTHRGGDIERSFTGNHRTGEGCVRKGNARRSAQTDNQTAEAYQCRGCQR